MTLVGELVNKTGWREKVALTLMDVAKRADGPSQTAVVKTYN